MRFFLVSVKWKAIILLEKTFGLNTDKRHVSLSDEKTNSDG
ncbi:MAG: hypothetical protein V4676_01465 [Bacteroidota bacterium]